MKPLILTLNLLCGADAATTHVALNKGAQELIMSQNPVVNDAILAGEAAGITAAMLKTPKQDRKAVKIVGWVFVGIRAAIVANNIRVIRHQP